MVRITGTIRTTITKEIKSNSAEVEMLHLL